MQAHLVIFPIAVTLIAAANIHRCSYLLSTMMACFYYFFPYNNKDDKSNRRGIQVRPMVAKLWNDFGSQP